MLWGLETCSIVAYVAVCAALCTGRLQFALCVFEIVGDQTDDHDLYDFKMRVFHINL
jgi:hypothetical protein